MVPFLISYPRGGSSLGGPTFQAAASLIRSSDVYTHRRHYVPTYTVARIGSRESDVGDVTDAIDVSNAARAAEVAGILIGPLPDLWQHPIRRKLSTFNKALWAKMSAAECDSDVRHDLGAMKQLRSATR